MSRQPYRRNETLTASDLLTTKVGDLFLLCRPDGDIDLTGGGGQGVYFRDTRFLNRLRLQVGRRELEVMSAGTRGHDRSVSDLRVGALEIRRERVLGPTIVETITVRNAGSTLVRTPLEIQVDSGFEAIFSVRRVRRDKGPRIRELAWVDGQLVLRRDGADGRVRTTQAQFFPTPARCSGGSARWRLRLPPGAETRFDLQLRVEERFGRRTRRPTRRRSGGQGPAWETDNPVFDRILARALDDVELLTMGGRNTT